MADVEELQKALEARRKPQAKASPSNEVKSDLLERLKKEVEAAKNAKQRGPEVVETPVKSAAAEVLPELPEKVVKTKILPAEPEQPKRRGWADRKPDPEEAGELEPPIVERVDLTGEHFLTQEEKIIVEKIKLALKKGITRDILREALHKDGFDNEEIDRYFDMATSGL